MGKMGSLDVLYVTHVSYRPKRMKRTIPVVRVPIITLLLQEYETPASWSAKIRGMGHETERMPPIPSSPRIRSVLDLPSARAGIEKKRRHMAMATIGPLDFRLDTVRGGRCYSLDEEDPSPGCTIGNDPSEERAE